MKNGSIRFVGIFGFIFFFAMGVNIAFKSWSGSTYVSQKVWFDGKRDLASVGKAFDFSNLSGNIFRGEAKSQMIERARVSEGLDRIGVQLGHFLVRTSEGKRNFICREHGRVEMTFKASGFAINGRRPVMVVDGLCNVANDVNYISTLWIPVKEIIKSSAGDVEFKFRGEAPVSVTFDGMGDSWPENWALSSVRFYSEGQKKGKEMVVEQRDILKLQKNKRLSLNWNRWIQQK